MKHTRLALGIIALTMMSGGCAGPYPIQINRGLSLMSYAKTEVNVYPCAASKDTAFAKDSDSQSVSPAFSGVTLVIDNNVAVPNGGGTASSNTVIPQLSLK